jgi:hypothetical protein
MMGLDNPCSGRKNNNSGGGYINHTSSTGILPSSSTQFNHTRTNRTTAMSGESDMWRYRGTKKGNPSASSSFDRSLVCTAPNQGRKNITITAPTVGQQQQRCSGFVYASGGGGEVSDITRGVAMELLIHLEQRLLGHLEPSIHMEIRTRYDQVVLYLTYSVPSGMPVWLTQSLFTGNITLPPPSSEQSQRYLPKVLEGYQQQQQKDIASPYSSSSLSSSCNREVQTTPSVLSLDMRRAIWYACACEVAREHSAPLNPRKLQREMELSTRIVNRANESYDEAIRRGSRPPLTAACLLPGLVHDIRTLLQPGLMLSVSDSEIRRCAEELHDRHPTQQWIVAVLAIQSKLQLSPENLSVLLSSAGVTLSAFNRMLLLSVDSSDIFLKSSSSSSSLGITYVHNKNDKNTQVKSKKRKSGVII